MTMRLSMSSLTGTVRTLVAVGTSRLASMFVTVRAAAPRSGACSGSSEISGWAGFGASLVTGDVGAGEVAGAVPRAATVAPSASARGAGDCSARWLSVRCSAGEVVRGGVLGCRSAVESEELPAPAGDPLLPADSLPASVLADRGLVCCWVCLVCCAGCCWLCLLAGACGELDAEAAVSDVSAPRDDPLPAAPRERKKSHQALSTDSGSCRYRSYISSTSHSFAPNSARGSPWGESATTWIASSDRCRRHRTRPAPRSVRACPRLTADAAFRSSGR